MAVDLRPMEQPSNNPLELRRGCEVFMLGYQAGWLYIAEFLPDTNRRFVRLVDAYGYTVMSRAEVVKLWHRGQDHSRCKGDTVYDRDTIIPYDQSEHKKGKRR